MGAYPEGLQVKTETNNKVSQRVTLHRNGDPIHFDVEIDFQKVALKIGPKAEKNRSFAATAFYGAIKVKLIS